MLDFRLGGFGLRFAQLDHDLKIFELFLRFEKRLGLVPQRIGFLDEFLGLVPVVPEIVSRH